MKPLAVILFADALSAIEVCWSLSDAGLEVLALQKHGRSCALSSSRFARVAKVSDPAASVAKTLADIESVLANESAQRPQRDLLLIPLDDAALYLSLRTKLPERAKLACPPTGVADLALDKLRQAELAKQAGFHAIPTALLDASLSLDTAVTPCILKPRFAVEVAGDRFLKRPFFACPNARALRERVEDLAPEESHILQPFIRGNGEGIFGLATPSGVVAISGHRRVRMMNPEGSGSSACESLAVEPELRKATEAFIELANWSGLFMIELLRDSSGKVWFMEFNGRPWGSMALARRRGLEYPAWHAQLALGEEIGEPRNAEDQTLCCRHIGRELVHMLFTLRGPRQQSNVEWPKCSSTALQLFMPKRNRRWYNFRWSDPLPFLRDTWDTVANVALKRR